jgi:7-cyano-7-deazaguanine synthase
MRETIDDIIKRVAAAQVHYDEDLKDIERIFIRNRGYVFKPPTNEPVVLVHSGGLDSTTAIPIIINDLNSVVYPLYIRRDAKNQVWEERAARFFYDYYKEKYPKNIGEFGVIKSSIPVKEVKSCIPKEYTQTIGHPMRNPEIQNKAVQHAAALNNKLDLDINTIFSCSVGDDNTEPELSVLTLRSENLVVCNDTANWKWQVTSPLTEPNLPNRPIFKSQLIKFAYWNKIPLEKTRTCFSEEEIADGTCKACVRRLKAFNEAGFVDPLPYKGVIE